MLSMLLMIKGHDQRTLPNTKSQISGLNIKKMFLVPKSFTHKSFDGAKNSKTNISCMGPFKALLSGFL